MKNTFVDKEKSYICGQCKTEIDYLATKSPPKTCPDCGYRHLSRDKYDVPSEIKINLRKY